MNMNARLVVISLLPVAACAASARADGAASSDACRRLFLGDTLSAKGLETRAWKMWGTRGTRNASRQSQSRLK